MRRPSATRATPRVPPRVESEYALRVTTGSPGGLLDDDVAVDEVDPSVELANLGRTTREQLVDRALCPAFDDHRLRLVGTTEAVSGYHFRRVEPEFSQVIACIGGEGAVWLPREGWRPCGEGTAYVTPAFRFHAYRALPRRHWRLAWVRFVETREAAPMVVAGQPCLLRVDARSLHAAISGLYREAIGPADPAFLRRWTELTVACAQRWLTGESSDNPLWRLWERVDSDLARQWSLGDLAELAGMSTERLRLLCQRCFASSPMHHLARLRVRRAAILLRSSPEPVKNVAASVGYRNPFAFSIAFKRVTGLSPSDYRAIRTTADVRR